MHHIIVTGADNIRLIRNQILRASQPTSRGQIFIERVQKF